MPPWSGRVFVTEQAFRLAQKRRLPGRPKAWKAPLLQGQEIALGEMLLAGPEAFLR